MFFIFISNLLKAYFVKVSGVLQFPDRAISVADTENKAIEMILYSIISMITKTYFGRIMYSWVM